MLRAVRRATSTEEMGNGQCVFCQIVEKKEPATILYEDNEFTVFSDIKPAAAHHYLVIPKHHIVNVKNLTNKDIPMVERMVEIGKKILQENHANTDKMRIERVKRDNIIYIAVSRLNDSYQDLCTIVLRLPHNDRLGFHWPPFTSINHLHLHAISPSDGIKSRYSLLGIFSPGTPWFVTADYVIGLLKSNQTAANP